MLKVLVVQNQQINDENFRYFVYFFQEILPALQ